MTPVSLFLLFHVASNLCCLCKWVHKFAYTYLEAAHTLSFYHLRLVMTAALGQGQGMSTAKDKLGELHCLQPGVQRQQCLLLHLRKA